MAKKALSLLCSVIFYFLTLIVFLITVVITRSGKGRRIFYCWHNSKINILSIPVGLEDKDAPVSLYLYKEIRYEAKASFIINRRNEECFLFRNKEGVELFPPLCSIFFI